MSIKQETIMVAQTVSSIVCDGCAEKRRSHDEDKWLSIHRPNTFDTFDFCSMACLATWATGQAAKTENGEAT